MNVQGAHSNNAVTLIDPAERNEALANARRTAMQNALSNAASSRERRSEVLKDTQALLARALGANTRLSVARKESSQTFVYRAIDVDTGEVVREWPPAEFASFVKDHISDAGAHREAGVVVDENA